MIENPFEKKEDKIAGTSEVANTLFSETPISNYEILKDKYQIKKLPKQNTLFIEGDKSFYMYFLIKGKVKIFRINEMGKEYITYIYREGEFFGHTPFLHNGIHNDNAVTLEDCEIVKFAKNDFLELISNSPEICLKFMQHLSFLLNENEKQSLRLAYNSARKKTADALIFVAKRYCKNVSCDSSFIVCRDDLSAISGVSSESISRNLTEFKKEGLIEGENGKLTILSLEKLETLKN